MDLLIDLMSGPTQPTASAPVAATAGSQALFGGDLLSSDLTPSTFDNMQTCRESVMLLLVC